MKRTYPKFLIILTIFFICAFSTTPGISTNNLTTNQQFVYFVNNYSVQASDGVNSISYTNFKVAGSPTMNPGSSDANFTIQYLSSDSSTVTFEFVKDSYTLQKTVNNTDPFGSGAISVPTGANVADYVNDVAYGSLPFILPVSGSTDALWTQLATVNFQTIKQSGSEYGIAVSIDESTSQTSSQFVINAKLSENGIYNGPNGVISGVSYGDNIKFNLQLNMVYDINTGVMMGYKSIVDSTMTLSGQTISLSMNIEITRQDYKFSSKSSPGFESLTVLFSLILIATVAVKLKKHKPKI